MSEQHTPGPWWVVGDMPGENKPEFPVIRTFVNGSKALTVCRVGSNNLYRSTNPINRDFMNARLIAAAPEMLAALRRAALALAFAAESSDAMRDDYEAVRAAIVKATGATS